MVAGKSVYSLNALITNLMAVKGLSRLRARLRAQIKGLTIIINLFVIYSGTLESPLGHLTQCTCLWRYLIVLSSGHLSLPVSTSFPTQHWSPQKAAAKDPHFDLQGVLPALLASIYFLTTLSDNNDIGLHRFRIEFCLRSSFICMWRKMLSLN